MEARTKVVVGTTEEKFGGIVRGDLALIDLPTGTAEPVLYISFINYFILFILERV
jgi:hypothetical protein